MRDGLHLHGNGPPATAATAVPFLEPAVMWSSQFMSDEAFYEGSFRLSESLVVAEVGDESVILEMESSRYFGLKGAMRFLIGSLREGIGFEAMVDTLCARFDVTHDAAARDLAGVIPQLLAAGLIVHDRD